MELICLRLQMNKLKILKYHIRATGIRKLIKKYHLMLQYMYCSNWGPDNKK